MKVEIQGVKGGGSTYQRVRKIIVSPLGMWSMVFYSGECCDLPLAKDQVTCVVQVEPAEYFVSEGQGLGVQVGKYRLWYGDRVLIHVDTIWPDGKLTSEHEPERHWRTGKVIGLGFTRGECTTVVVSEEAPGEKVHTLAIPACVESIRPYQTEFVAEWLTEK